MNTRRALLLALCVVVLGGCAAVEHRLLEAGFDDAPPGSADAAVEQARGLAADGHWMAAQRLLESAQRRYQGDPLLTQELASVAAQRQRVERRLQDSLLVEEAEHERRRIDLLDQLAAVLPQPESLLLVSRRLFLKERLGGRLPSLIDCAELHLTEDPELARRCLDLAAALPADAMAEQRLAAVSEQLRLSEAEAAARRLAAQRRERQRRARALLTEAHAAIERHDYRRALDLVAQVAELQPEDREAAGLRDRAEAMLSPQIEALIRLGDHLYLDEQLEAAVATWQGALALMPGDEEVQARIERARTVLGRLEELRRKQQTTADGD